MTKQKTFKHRVRSRMEKTGESYTAARRMLIAGPKESAATQEATGRGNEEWFALLDEWGAADRPAAGDCHTNGRTASPSRRPRPSRYRWPSCSPPSAMTLDACGGSRTHRCASAEEMKRWWRGRLAETEDAVGDSVTCRACL